MDFSEDDLQRAFEAAFEAGARTPTEIKAFVVEWLQTWNSPLVHVEAWQTEVDKALGRISISVSSYRPTDTKH